MEIAQEIAGEGRVFLATCVPRDDEMKDRVVRHQEERGAGWTAVEAPVDLPEAILEHSRRARVILADCLTLWISNLYMESMDVEPRVEALTDAIRRAECPVIVVSNEVGTGIVPENALARRYRDSVGFANQKTAACADEVVWMVAGIPVKIKG